MRNPISMSSYVQGGFSNLLDDLLVIFIIHAPGNVRSQFKPIVIALFAPFIMDPPYNGTSVMFAVVVLADAPGREILGSGRSLKRIRGGEMRSGLLSRGSMMLRRAHPGCFFGVKQMEEIIETKSKKQRRDVYVRHRYIGCI